MSRGFVALASVVLAIVGVTGIAAAAPSVTLKVKALPIPGFPGTGDVLGAGAEVEVQVTISGNEYGGYPSPLTGINLYSPSGSKIDPAGFVTCADAVLENDGGAGCPRHSSAGPPGVGLGVVAFGGHPVPEKVSIESFFAPGGGLTFLVEGRTPAYFQVLEKAHVVDASPPYGQEVIVEVPLVETAPGANDASVTSFTVKVGAAYRRAKKTVSYFTQATRCPRGGFPAKLEMKFLSGETATVIDSVPCPHRRG
ncbi:MAG TPA: hypothetical protein VGL79_03315 [Solirubrobacteraceae bacterium]|jgi:hypothetical protein